MNNSQSGVGMIEVLVAVLVLAVGLIGMAGLVGASLNSNAAALNRSNAMYLAESIIERMRSFDTPAQHDLFLTAFDENPSVSPSVCTQEPQGAPVNCTHQQLIDSYVSNWKCQLGGYDSRLCDGFDSFLPDAIGEITADPVKGSHIINIQWLGAEGFFGDGVGQSVENRTSAIRVEVVL